MQTTFQRVYGNSDDFDAGFASIVALQPLLALMDTTKTSLSTVLGSANVKELQKAIGQAMQGMKLFQQSKTAFDNLSVNQMKEAGIDDIGLIDMINTLQGASSLADDVMKGIVLDLNNSLTRITNEFKGTFSEQRMTIDEASNILEEAKKDMSTLVKAFNVDVAPKTQIDVATKQLERTGESIQTTRQAFEEREMKRLNKRKQS